MQQDLKEFIPLLPTPNDDDDFVEPEDFFGKEFMQQVLENERNPHQAYSVISALLPSQQANGTTASDKTLKTLRTIKRTKQHITEHDGKSQENSPDDVELRHKITGSMDLFEGWEDASESNEEAYLWKLGLVRNMPISMASKRKQKERLTSKYNVAHVKVSSEPNNNKLCSQFKENLHDVFSSLAIWRGLIKQIEGHFGASIASYFVFGRWLLFLNIVIFMLTFLLIVLPQILLSKFNAFRQKNEEIENCSNIYSHSLNRQNEKIHIYILDFLQGTGWMESTLMFIGSYENLIHMHSPVFNLSLSYFLTISSVLLLSLILILRTTAHGVKKGVIISEGKLHNYCNTVFGGWDFCIIKSEAARLKSEMLTTELLSYLEEERLQQQRQSRTLKEKIYLYFVRCVINLIVFGLLIGGWVAIYEASGYTLNHLKKHRQEGNEIKKEQTFEDLIKEYVPSLTISALNIVMPNVFYILVQYDIILNSKNKEFEQCKLN